VQVRAHACDAAHAPRHFDTARARHAAFPFLRAAGIYRAAFDLTRAARYPLDPPAIVDFLRLGYWLISKVRGVALSAPAIRVR
jgi:hypothetical protein